MKKTKQARARRPPSSGRLTQDLEPRDGHAVTGGAYLEEKAAMDRATQSAQAVSNVTAAQAAVASNIGRNLG